MRETDIKIRFVFFSKLFGKASKPSSCDSLQSKATPSFEVLNNTKIRY